MLAGRRPFQGDSHLLTLTAILRDPPPPLKSIRADVPAPSRSGSCALAREASGRPVPVGRTRWRTEHRAPARRSRLGSVPAAAPLLGVRRLRGGVGGGCSSSPRRALFWLVRESRVRRARDVTLPEIARLVEQQKSARGRAPRPRGGAVRPRRGRDAAEGNVACRLAIETEPDGRGGVDEGLPPTRGDWQPLGTTPIRDAACRSGTTGGGSRSRDSRRSKPPGRCASKRAARPGLAAVPPGMVRVAGRERSRSGAFPPCTLDDFWIDKYEVTNGQFKEFVDAGGLSRNASTGSSRSSGTGASSPWEEAMASSATRPGVPGPRPGSSARFPRATSNYPVDGVSWYEAAAYAEFAGKSLPTCTTGTRPRVVRANFSDILQRLQLRRKGRRPRRDVPRPEPRTARTTWPATSRSGAGTTRAGRRFIILGGAWIGSRTTCSARPDAQDPFTRAARATDSDASDTRNRVRRRRLDGARSRRSPATTRRRRRSRTTCSASIAASTPTTSGPLDVRNEGVRGESPVLAPAEGQLSRGLRQRADPGLSSSCQRTRGRRIRRSSTFPSTVARLTRSSADMDIRILDFVIRSGRAVLLPDLQGHVRAADRARRRRGPNFRRDLVIQWSKDLGRSIDYLETRPDIDRDEARVLRSEPRRDRRRSRCVAVEDRFQDGRALCPADFGSSASPPGGRADQFHAARPDPRPPDRGPLRLRAPVRDGAAAVLPAARDAGEGQEARYVFEGGHIPATIQPIIKEILDWLDRYLGPVAPVS